MSAAPFDRWQPPKPLRVAIFSQRHPLLSAEQLDSIRAAIDLQATLTWEDVTGHPATWEARDMDLLVTLGGDGTILHAARSMGTEQRPVLGVNLGKLGFLADIAVKEFPTALRAVVDGQCRIVRHMMFECQVWRRSQLLETHLGLNEAAVLGGPPYSLQELDLYIDGELVTTYSCDGLIVSTPVGSTAHSLSAGGPIIRKDVHAFVISAVSPHTLTVRPVVDTAERVYEISAPQSPEATAVVVDGQLVHRLGPEDRVLVRRAAPQFALIEVPGHSYYRTLREKLGWSGKISRPPSG